MEIRGTQGQGQEKRASSPPVDPQLAAALAVLLEEGDEVDAARVIVADLEDTGLSLSEREDIAAEVVAWLLED